MKNQRFLNLLDTSRLAQARSVVRLFGVLFLMAITAPLSAQTVTMRANPVRITVALGAASSNYTTVTVVTAGLAGNGVNFSVAGVPADTTATFGTNSITADGTHTVGLTLFTTPVLAQGTYDLAIEASGAAAYRLPVPLICSYVWSGSDKSNNVTANLTSSGNWFGGAVPGSTDNVVFRDSGGDSANTTTNVIISADTTFASVRFANELDNSTDNHNIEFQSGAKLRVTSPGGFSLLRDSKTVGRGIDVRMFGEGGLVVSNPNADFGTYIDFQVNATLDLRNLNTLDLDVRRIPLGDYRAYPNYFTNGWRGTGIGTGGANEVNRFVTSLWLARTNVIKASFVDPNNYADLGQRDYALTIGNNNVQGSTSNLRLTFGISNAIFLDSICFAQAIAGGSGNNFNFNATNSYALFRGTGGLNSRIAVFALADTASSTPQGVRANSRSQVNFANQNNCVADALIDQLWVSVDRTNYMSTNVPPESMAIQSSLTYGAGTFDVNTAYLGYQRCGDNPNAGVGFQIEATLNLNSNANSAGAIMKINRDLHLGFTTATAPGNPTTAERTWGRVVITGGTLMVSNILCGGTTKLATNNQITVNGGKLIVTNAIGAADARVAVLTLSGSPEVTLLGVKADETNVFVNTFSAVSAGGPKRIRIPSIAGVTSYPVVIPLISYTSTTAPVFNGMYVVPPDGLYVKTITDNTTDKVIQVEITDEPPIVVVWRGNINSLWDLSTRNWVTQSGIATNYSDGFSVIFDDTVAGGPTSIDISAAVTPGQVAAAYGVVVSNRSYTFNSGAMFGSATVYKTGAGNLTVNATLTPGMTVNAGALLGNGTIGPTLLQNGAAMTAFTGTINGGLAASNATVTVTGPVNGGLNLQAGSLANAHTINGNVTLATDTTLDNRPGATINVTLPWTVSTNATLINNGDIFQFGASGANQGLTVRGVLKGVGRIVQDGNQASSDCRVTIDAGGSLTIGNSANEITNTTIAVRLDFNAGSVTTFDVDNSGAQPVNDKIILNATPNGYGKVNFGIGNNLGGTLQINKIVGPAFHAATAIYPFDLTANQPDNSQPAIPQITPPPAPDLTWDTYQVVTNLTLVTTTPMVYTNFITTSTNGTVSYVFDWPANYRGWRVERQTNSLTVGLEPGGTNWVTVFTAYGGTNVLYYPDITNDPGTFWIRTTQNLSTTNDGPLAPTIFYRFVYP